MGEYAELRLRFFVLVEPGHVVLRQFDAAVQGDDVPDIELDSFRLDAFGDAFQFLLIFGIDVRPEHLAAGLAEELPIALGVVCTFKLDDPDHVVDFGESS